jgi:hypothetical protein
MTSFDQPGFVSLWLFQMSEAPADAEKDVLKDFCGVDSYDVDQQEGVVKEALTRIRLLIDPLSYSMSFIEEAVAAAEGLDIAEAYGVLAQYDFAYDPAEVARPVASDPIFVGCFQWRE